MGSETPAQRHDSPTQPAPVGARFWSQLVLGGIFTVLFVITFITPTWIETLFDASPDAGNGSAEWWIVVVFGVAALVSFAFAGREWRHRAHVLQQS
jgi:hypothetical protein